MAKKVDFDEVGFSENELKVLAFLADDRGHAEWEMVDQFKIDKGYLSRTLKGLKNRELIYNEERSLVRPKGERGAKIEYPFYIQKKKWGILRATFFRKSRLP